MKGKMYKLQINYYTINIIILYQANIMMASNKANVIFSIDFNFPPIDSSSY
jgi:hypothetical protein